MSGGRNLRLRLAALALAALVLITPRLAAAQSAANAPGPALRPWHPVVSIGGAWMGGQDLGTVKAQTRTAVAGTATPPGFTLFTTSSTLDGAAAGEFAVTLPVTRRWAVTVRAAVARPTLSTAISSDAEGAPAITATEQVSDYTVDAAVTYQLSRLGGRRARPYLAAGGGYLRQLHEDDVLVETGSTWHAGAGLRYWLRGGGRTGTVGLTGEARWVWRSGAIAFADGARALPVVAAGLFVSF